MWIPTCGVDVCWLHPQCIPYRFYPRVDGHWEAVAPQWKPQAEGDRHIFLWYK